MRSLRILLAVALAAFCLRAVAQNITPDAPSATQQQQRPAAAQPALPTPAPATPQATAPAPPAEDKPADEGNFVVKVPVNEVNLIFTASDKRGRFVRDLKPADVKVLDDRKPPTQVRSFRSETDLPLRVGLMVDASNSIRDRFKFEQEAAIEFLSQIIRPKSDRAFVIGFDTTPEVTQDFTDQTEKLSRGVRMLRPGGGTALYDAIYFACRDKLAKIDPGTAVRRAIIILSDGEDNQSRVSREEAIDMAIRAEVIIYAISTNVSGMASKGDKVLERMAEATGGRAFFPFKIQDVADAFKDVQEELRSQYAISYKPADFRADGRYREIELAAQDKKVKLRYRRGYYAPKQ